MNNDINSILILGCIIFGWVAAREKDKTQIIRVVDVLLYGPFIIWIGLNTKTAWKRASLIILGGTTIGYNARNFYKNYKLKL